MAERLTSSYPFPVYGIQGGGLVKEVAPDLYQFVEAPESCPGLEVGDFMPKEWGIASVNEAARQVEFNEESDWSDEFFSHP